MPTRDSTPPRRRGLPSPPSRPGKTATTTPFRPRRSDDDDTSPRRPTRPTPPGKVSGSKPTALPRKKSSLQGWEGLQAKKEKMEARESARHPKEFYLKDGEIAHVQFLDDEPFVFDAHNVRNRFGGWEKVPCQLASQKYCLLCQEGSRPTTYFAFRILDYRGTWDKNEKEYTWDKPVVRPWVPGLRVAQALKAYSDKKGKELSELVIEITATGSGTSKSHNLSPAMDDRDRLIRPTNDYEDVEGTCEDWYSPYSDDTIEANDYEIPDSF